MMDSIANRGDDNDVNAALYKKFGIAQRNAPVLESLQVQACEQLGKIIDKVAALLDTNPKSGNAGAPLTLAGATSSSRRREQAAKERRAIAEGIVITALKNLDNPSWDPGDPSTSQTDSDSVILALLGRVSAVRGVVE